jgi:penicillin V acylase-like amidase (Ntn superfamily)
VGKAIVIAYAEGRLAVFDAPLGVITNAPTYDWHETNLRNYVNLQPVAIPEKKLEDLNFHSGRRVFSDRAAPASGSAAAAVTISPAPAALWRSLEASPRFA